MLNWLINENFGRKIKIFALADDTRVSDGRLKLILWQLKNW